MPDARCEHARRDSGQRSAVSGQQICCWRSLRIERISKFAESLELFCPMPDANMPNTQCPIFS
ncbi:MAG: hypothetical protein F6J93_18695 [Oscillatoria sp. SIO1A7]|nr:hypothetical protein [Oscillatoria sp. SIO1A7]